LEAPEEHDEDTLAYEITPPPTILVSSSTYGLREMSVQVQWRVLVKEGIKSLVFCRSGPHINTSMTSEGMYVYARWSHRLIN
jgi:hypothetical protein